MHEVKCKIYMDHMHLYEQHAKFHGRCSSFSIIIGPISKGLAIKYSLVLLLTLNFFHLNIILLLFVVFSVPGLFCPCPDLVTTPV